MAFTLFTDTKDLGALPQCPALAVWQEKIMKLNFHEIEFLLAEVPAACVVLDMACLTRAGRHQIKLKLKGE